MPIEIESPEQLGYGNIDCNLAESSVTDAVYRDLSMDIKDLVLAYGDHRGKPELRQIVAGDGKGLMFNGKWKVESGGLSAEDVLLTAGAASALFIVNTALLTGKDQIVVVKPNYATNIETPLAIGCEVALAQLEFEKGFKLDIAALEKLITPKTRLVSVTNPNNPTGAMLSEAELQKLVDITAAKKCYLLVDETYRDLALGHKPPLVASLADHVISVSSLSKAYGFPGIRIGWLITRNKALQELFLAAKEQIFVCNSVVDEEIAYRFLLKKDEVFPSIEKHVKENFGILKAWMNRPGCLLEWVEPEGGVVCFPRIKRAVDTEKFYSTLNTRYKTYVGPGHWFGMDKRYMRIGFGWPGSEELERGLKNIERVLNGEL